jgi:hypothetical protein
MMILLIYYIGPNGSEDLKLLCKICEETTVQRIRDDDYSLAKIIPMTT